MQINGNSVEFSYDGLDEAFPPCDAGVKPFGSRVLCQIRTPKTKTKGGIILVPRYGGDRWSVKTDDGEEAIVVIFNDLDLVGKVTGDPLAVKAFL
jgi:hypothetical protein